MKSGHVDFPNFSEFTYILLVNISFIVHSVCWI